MARYVDGFVFPIPTKNQAAYRKIAAKAGKVWMKHGALAYMECLGDDLTVKGGPLSFIKLAKPKQGETVGFSFIVFKSRKHRDQVNAKVMKDPMMNDPAMAKEPMPFDMKRMAYGGFTALVDL